MFKGAKKKQREKEIIRRFRKIFADINSGDSKRSSGICCFKDNVNRIFPLLHIDNDIEIDGKSDIDINVLRACGLIINIFTLFFCLSLLV